MSRLLEPISLGALALQHRVVMAPLTRLRSDPATGVPSELAVEYYTQRASGESWWCPSSDPSWRADHR